MSAIQKIFRTYGKEYLELYGDRMPGIHKKAIKDMTECRRGHFGAILYGCDDCNTVQPVPCCCGNRHCPSCHQYKAEEWLSKQMENLLPSHYFLLTVTLPEELRPFARSNQRIVYKAMFSCVHGALKKLAKDKKYVGSDRIGYLAVLHTWGSRLQYHPHIHVVIPGGAVTKDGDKWLPSRQDMFVHTKPFAIIFRAKIKDEMEKAGVLHKIDPSVWQKEWVAHNQYAGKGENTLRYLSRYVFRVAISNNRIKRISDNAIRFSYKDRERKTWKTMELKPVEFIRRFLQHVLPGGFMKIRHYGFLNPNSSLSIDRLRELISLVHAFIEEVCPVLTGFERPKITCACCGKPMRYVAFLKPVSRCGPV
jgi:hypothetical protein